MPGKLEDKQSARLQRSNRWIFGVLLLCAIAGLASSFSLSVEKLRLLQDPAATLSCSFNAVLNCASVMKTPQAIVFGFPNSFIGLMEYPVVITLAVAGLAGVRFPRMFMLVAQVWFGLGLIFAYWLFFQSIYVIQILCPWCLVVTLATTLLFETLLRYNLRENNLSLPETWRPRVVGWLERGYDKALVAVWIAVMVCLVLVQFGDALFA